MARADNQDAACDFVRRIVAARTGESLKVTDRPDISNRSTQAVEELWESDTRRYAVEHTLVETFDRQIEDGEKFHTLMAPLEVALAGRMPGTFVLRIGIGEVAKARRLKYDAVRLEIATLALSVADTLAVEQSATLKSDTLPFEVDIYRRQAEGSKVVAYRGFQGDTIEDRRTDRIRRALEKKCPKLGAAAAQDGRTSVLILESDDTSLSNIFVVNAAVQRALSERMDQPDQVFIVETDSVPLSARIVKEGKLRGDTIQRVTGKPSHYEDGNV